jgi:hypothetical protein
VTLTAGARAAKAAVSRQARRHVPWTVRVDATRHPIVRARPRRGDSGADLRRLFLQRDCTAIGYVDDLTLQVSFPPAPATYRLELEAEGDEPNGPGCGTRTFVSASLTVP